MRKIFFITIVCAFMSVPALADLTINVPGESLLSFAGQTQASLAAAVTIDLDV